MSLLKEILAEASEVDKVSELALLLRCSQFPTIVMEDLSDVRIYNRWIEGRLFNTYNVNVLAAGGRDNLLNLYERRNEFAHLPVAFVANRGMWMFPEIPGNKIPEKYAGIIFTDGYSIENDIYSKSRIENLIPSGIDTDFSKVKESIIRWFASEVAKFQEKNFQGINPDLDELVPKGQTELDKSFHIRLGFVKSDIRDGIRDGYRLKLPGKLLFQMVARFSDISLDGLYNTALVNYEAEPQELIEKIKGNLGKHESENQGSPNSKGDENKSLLYINPTSESDLSVVDNFVKNPTSTSESDLSVVDNFIKDLRKTDTPTVVVAGKDSADIIERLIEAKEQDAKVSVRHISGRDSLLAVYAQRDKFAHLPVAFVADQEMWRFSEIPKGFADIIWTQGYSLENDLYAESNLESLIDPHEKWKHQQVLNATIKWFAFKVEEFLDGKPLNIDEDVRSLDNIVLPGQLELNEKFCEENNFREPSAEHIQNIKEDYEHRLPGKFLFQILERFLNTRGRSFNYDVTVRGLHDIVLMAWEVGDIINAKILKNDGTKVTVQLISEQPSYILIQRIYQTLKLTRTSEEITFELEHYSGQVGDEHKMKVRSIDRGRVKEVIPLQHEFKVGDKINAKILKKDGIKVTVQLITANAEEITFEQPYYLVQVGDEHKMKVMSVKRGRVDDVIPLPREVKFGNKIKHKVGDKINAKIQKKEGFKVTVQLITDNHEEITFEYPYFPGQAGEEVKLRVDSVDSTGKVIDVTFKGLKKSN